MKAQLQAFSEELVKRVCHFLWRQWGQLGLASAEVKPRDGWMIDPEALLLLSATYARYDARLFDEIMDWVLKNARYLNIPRLKSALRRYEFTNARVVSAVLKSVAARNGRLHWSVVEDDFKGTPEPLFFDMPGRPLVDFGSHDDIFLAAGFERGKVEMRGLSRRFNAVMPECALLRLRALFGVSARADIIAYLLTHDTAHPSGIARDTGFSQKNVQDTLVDMSASKIVSTATLEGRMKQYFILDEYRSCLFHSYGESSCHRWVAWLPIFRILDILLLEIPRVAMSGSGSLMCASLMRDLKQRIKHLIEQGGSSAMFADEAVHTGESYAPLFLAELDKWLSITLKEAK